MPHSDFVPQKLGSSKRKPKEVHRIMQAPTTENEIPEDCESPNWFNEQVRFKAFQYFVLFVVLAKP